MNDVSYDDKCFILKPKLLSAFSDVGAENNIYSFREVCLFLKQYLFKNRSLIDKDNPLLVKCLDDPLGKALGVESFTYQESRALLAKNIYKMCPLSPTAETNLPSTSSDNSIKQKGTFIPFPTVPNSLSESEDTCSIQGYETALCKESSSEDELELIYQDEYELVPEDEEEVHSSDTDADESLVLQIIATSDDGGFNDEESCLADESSSSSSDLPSESSEEEQDCWPCLECGIKNKPFMRYCLKCWQLRKGWLPDRPKKRKRRRVRPKKNKKPQYNPLARFSSVASSTSTSSATSTSTTGSQDSGIGMPATQELLSDDLSDAEDSAPGQVTKELAEDSFSYINHKRKLELEEDPSFPSKVARTAESSIPSLDMLKRKMDKLESRVADAPGMRELYLEVAQSLKDVSVDSSDEDFSSKGLCTICCIRPFNASIVHGRKSHLGFCYACAKRVFNEKKRCPTCRQKIQKVTKNYF